MSDIPLAYNRGNFWLIALVLWLFWVPCWAIDQERYITIDQIRPDMDAYCLTVLQGDKIERFDLEILSVARNYQPGMDAIFVVGTDERFKKVGPVKGCSGSPVYIDNRLAGALSKGAMFADDPFYIVMPIEHMLDIGKVASLKHSSGAASRTTLDLAQPLNFAQVLQDLNDSHTQNPGSGLAGLDPIYTSLPQSVCSQLAESFKPLGLVPVAGASQAAAGQIDDDVSLEPGGVIVIPLSTGDISFFVAGTVTDVVGDKVYALGHGFLGYGEVDLPMATGKIHATLASSMFSQKIAEAGQIKGAIRVDQSAGVLGMIGETAKMIPTKITVDRYNDTRQRVYNSQISLNDVYTPMIIQSSIIGTALLAGEFPPEHTVEYKATISVDGFDPITFQNVSSEASIRDLADETAGTVAFLMVNPYRKTDITSIDIQFSISQKNTLAQIYSIQLSDSKVKPGQSVDLDVTMQLFLAAKKTYSFKFDIPRDLKPGKYQIAVMGSRDYESILRKNAPHKFAPENLNALVKALQNLLDIKRDKIYVTMSIPAQGIVLQKSELPYLPKTKALLLHDTKKTTKIKPYKTWLEKIIDTQYVIKGKQTMDITVEKP